MQNHRDDDDPSHGASWRQLVHRKDHSNASSSAQDQTLRLLEAAEEVINEQGEDLIRYNVRDKSRTRRGHFFFLFSPFVRHPSPPPPPLDIDMHIVLLLLLLYFTSRLSLV